LIFHVSVVMVLALVILVLAKPFKEVRFTFSQFFGYQ
jgi:uncharacterized membrane protein YagU involved in acid resistance